MSALKITVFATIHETGPDKHWRTEEIEVPAADVAEVKEILAEFHAVMIARKGTVR